MAVTNFFNINWSMEGLQCLEKFVVVEGIVYGALGFKRTGKCGFYIRVMAVVALEAIACVVVLLIYFKGQGAYCIKGINVHKVEARWRQALVLMEELTAYCQLIAMFYVPDWGSISTYFMA